MPNNYQIERLIENTVVSKPQAPHWDVTTKSLYFVDIMQKTVNKFTPSTKSLKTVPTGDKKPSSIIPVDGSTTDNNYLIALDNALLHTRIDWDGSTEKSIELIKVLTELDPGTELKFNNGKCDSSGRLWIGTWSLNLDNWDTNLNDLSVIQANGVLYSFNGGDLVAHRKGLKIPVGLTWNDKTGKFYYVDSLTECIDEYDYDRDNGTISNCRPFFTLTKHDIPGVPDGLTIDIDGNLWVAVFGGSRVIKVSSEQPETLLGTVLLPANQVISLTFGGVNFDELYVTTAYFPNSGYNVNIPVDGAVYRIMNLGGVKGSQNNSFNLHLK